MYVHIIVLQKKRAKDSSEFTCIEHGGDCSARLEYVKNCNAMSMKSYESISALLKQTYPLIGYGLPARSVRRFCSSNKILKKKGPQLDVIAAQSVSEVYLYVLTFHFIEVYI